MIGFTKIKWAGIDCILITESEHAREPLLILDSNDMEKLIEEWKPTKKKS